MHSPCVVIKVYIRLSFLYCSCMAISKEYPKKTPPVNPHSKVSDCGCDGADVAVEGCAGCSSWN